MITPELKDRILSDIVGSPMNCTLNVNTDCTHYGIDRDEFYAILQHFDSLNLISIKLCNDGQTFISTAVKAHDLLRNGGFVGQEMILKANIEKLGMEIDKLSDELSTSQLDTAHKIASIGSAIISALTLFK